MASEYLLVAPEYGVAFWDVGGHAVLMEDWTPERRIAEAWLDTAQAEHPNVEHFLVERVARRALEGEA